MNSINFLDFKETLLKHCKTTIEEFAKTPQNKDVYVFVLDSNFAYGDVLIRWNTLEGLAHTLTFDCYKDYTDERVYGYNGLKHSVGDFRYEDGSNDELVEFMRKYSEAIEELWDNDQETEHLVNSFSNTLIEVVQELSPHFELFDTTENFIAYISDHDEDLFKYIKKTVSDEQYYKAFPEIKAYEEFKRDLEKTPLDNQIAFWCQAIVDFELNIESDNVKTLKKMYRHKFDVSDQIEYLGQPAVSSVITLLEMFLGYRPFYNGEQVKLDPWTCQSIILNIGKADEHEIQRIKSILARQREEGNEHQANNTERVLNTIDPERFPE